MFTFFKSQLEFVSIAFTTVWLSLFLSWAGVSILSLHRTQFTVAVLTHSSLRVANSDSCDAPATARTCGPRSWDRQSPAPCRAEPNAGGCRLISHLWLDIRLSWHHWLHAMGRRWDVWQWLKRDHWEVKSGFNCIRESCQIKLAEVLLN